MRGINRVTIVGTIGKDIEIRHIPPNNDAVCNVSIATNEEWKDKNTGEKQSRTEWHRIAFFKQHAEFLSKYAGKGSVIYVEGSLQTKKFLKEGKDNYKTEIKCHEVQILSGGKGVAQQNQSQQQADPDWGNT